jgi:hypothetical protein
MNSDNETIKVRTIGKGRKQRIVVMYPRELHEQLRVFAALASRHLEATAPKRRQRKGLKR